MICFLYFPIQFRFKMNVSRKMKQKLVMKDRVFKNQNTKTLFETLKNLCRLLMSHDYLDHCYCNISSRQCWICNFSNYVVSNKILDNLIPNNRHHLIDMAYKFLFYIKRIRNDGLESDDREWVLDFFKLKID